MASVRDNIVNLDVVYSKLNTTIDKNIELLKEGASAVDAYNKKISVVPSEFKKSLEDIKTKTDAVTKSTTELTAVEKERIRVEKQLEQTSAKIKIANEQNTTTLNTQKSVLRALNGAYAELNEKHKRASQTLQDLIVRGRTAEQTQRQYNRELKNAKQDFQNLDSKIKQADTAVGRFNRNVGNYPKQAILGIRNLMGAFGIVGGVTLFATLVKDIFQTTKELQSLDNALKQVTATNEVFARSQSFLREISEDYGLEINGLTKQFTQFYVSAKDKLSGTEIENIFRSISKAGATMGLSVDSQQRAFLALNQMMSKGTVQAEELRGQLGEALPGAFGIMAKAVGVTEKQLSGMMKSGQLLSDEVLPKFAKQLEKTYGIETVERVETLNASTQRLSNTWTDFVRNLNDSETGGISVFFKTIIDGLNDMFKTLIDINNFYSKDGKFIFENWKKGIDNLVPENTKESLIFLNKELEKTNKIAKNQEKTISVYEKRIADPRNSKTSTAGKQTIKDLEDATKKYNATLSAQSYLQSLIKEKTSERIKLENDFVLAFTQKNKKVTESVALDYAKLKSDEQLKKEIDSLTDKTNKNTKATDKNKKAKDKNKKAQEDVRFALIGSVEWFEKLKSALELEQKQLSTNNPKWEEYRLKIEQVQKSIDAITKASKELDGVTIDFGDTSVSDAEGDEIMRQGNDLREWYKDFRNSFQDDFWANSGFSKIQFIIDNFDKLKESGTDMALAISDAMQQAFNTISEMSQSNFDAEYERLEAQRDFSIEMAGGSVTAKEEIERQYEERRKAIARRKAESDKKLAIFNAVINTAQAVTSALAEYDYFSAILFGVLGAAQIAMISSQQIPQFWKGTDNAPEGLAWTQEKGAEVITDKKGNVKSLGSDKGAQLTYLSKGDKVYKSHEDYINKVLSKNGIAELGSYMNFTPKTEIINNGITKADLEQNFSKLASVIKNKEGVSISIDEKGFRKSKGNTEFINSRLNIKSRTV